MSNGKLVKGSQNYVWFSDQRLGKGAMGTVYLARHRRKGTKLAAKTFNARSKMTEFIQRELSILRQMTDHEHIVKLVAIEEETYSKDSVVIMELCDGGSLQRLLDEPRNYYGLAHDEWIIVFTHTFKALNHLHHHKIIHRDIKPGNILLQNTTDGSHIYKLTDFGASKIQDEDEEGFKSLCGTEEYLHPELHSSAFIRRIPGQVYGHYVDIWSFGVTMYQCATGRLPFRPREGIRKNKQMMNDLMTKKARGVISRYEREDGQIVEERELPPTSRLFTGTKEAVEQFLARIFDLEEQWSESQFFHITSDFCDKQPIYLYFFNRNAIICAHLKDSDSLTHLKEEIARYTETPSNNQILSTKDGPLEEIVTPGEKIKNYPVTSPEEPIYVVDRHPGQEGHVPSFDKLPSLPEPAPGESPLVSDAHWAAQVCGNIYHFVYLTQYLVWIQSHLLILRTSLNDMIKKLCHVVVYAIGRQQHTQEYLNKLWRTLQTHHWQCLESPGHLKNFQSKLPSVDRFLSVCQREHELLETQYTHIEENIRQIAPLVKKGLKPSCVSQARCREKGEVLIKEVLPLYEAIREDKSKGELSHNDMEIHKYNKSELKRAHRGLRDNVSQHCVEQARLYYQETSDFCRTLLQTVMDLKALEKSLVAFDEKQKHLGDDILKLLSQEYLDEPRTGAGSQNDEPLPSRFKSRIPEGPHHYGYVDTFPNDYHQHNRAGSQAVHVYNDSRAKHSESHNPSSHDPPTRRRVHVRSDDPSVRPRNGAPSLFYLSGTTPGMSNAMERMSITDRHLKKPPRLVGRSAIDTSTANAEPSTCLDSVGTPIQVSGEMDAGEHGQDF